MYSVKLRLSDVSRVEYWELSNTSANIAGPSSGRNIYWSAKPRTIPFQGRVLGKEVTKEVTEGCVKRKFRDVICVLPLHQFVKDEYPDVFVFPPMAIGRSLNMSGPLAMTTNSLAHVHSYCTWVSFSNSSFAFVRRNCLRLAVAHVSTLICLFGWLVLTNTYCRGDGNCSVLPKRRTTLKSSAAHIRKPKFCIER
jgi:hypothetical protein